MADATLGARPTATSRDKALMAYERCRVVRPAEAQTLGGLGSPFFFQRSFSAVQMPRPGRSYVIKMKARELAEMWWEHPLFLYARWARWFALSLGFLPIEINQQFREMQRELAHANRVAAIFQITASIAHEVKQPITATVVNARTARRFLSAEPADLDEVRAILDAIVRDGNRAADIIDRIRAFLKKSPPREDRLEINRVIREVLEFTRSEAVKNGISVQTELADGLPFIQGDRVELQQVILNLIINAVEAMSGTDEVLRELLISTEKARSGGVLVAVRDSGPGFGSTTFNRVFDPFYTTKPSGLGVGLSICRSIVEAHGGRLWASANVSRGATFQFTLVGLPPNLQPADLPEGTARSTAETSGYSPLHS